MCYLMENLIQKNSCVWLLFQDNAIAGAMWIPKLHMIVPARNSRATDVLYNGVIKFSNKKYMCSQ